MTDEGKKTSESQGEITKSPKRLKDRWDKADVLFKFLAAALIAAFGFFGNQYLQDKQKIDSDIKLYTEIMSNKERAENSLRKDMFGEMLQSFLKRKDAKDESQQTTLSKIREMRLSLELLSRNFHESLDMKPLFNHLLMEIVRPRKSLRAYYRALKKEGNGEEQVKKAIDRAEKMTNEKIAKDEKEVNRLLKRYDRELDLLVRTAKRVTRKQREVLEEVAGKIKLEIPLKDQPTNKICTYYKPGVWLPKEDGTCEPENGKTVIEGESADGTIIFKTADRDEGSSSSRYFRMKVRYVYPRWKQIYVEILTCPKEKGCEENPEKDTASFWLEYFDFPLVEHTYLNGEERYSVILESFKEDQHGNAEKAEITLLYYPSSYAGLKEKSYYNIQLMRGLVKSKLFGNLK